MSVVFYITFIGLLTHRYIEKTPLFLMDKYRRSMEHAHNVMNKVNTFLSYFSSVCVSVAKHMMCTEYNCNKVGEQINSMAAEQNRRNMEQSGQSRAE
jgi:hypothetical protein